MVELCDHFRKLQAGGIQHQISLFTDIFKLFLLLFNDAGACLAACQRVVAPDFIIPSDYIRYGRFHVKNGELYIISVPQLVYYIDELAEKFTAPEVGYKDRLLYQNVGAGETIDIHRTTTPVSVKVIESECILPTEEKFDSSVHPLVLLDVLMTSLLSTSIDSSTGAMWRYDETLHVTPKIKDTPECRKWLEEQVGKMDPNVLSKPITRGPLYDSGNKFPTDPDAVVHPKGFENGFSKK